MSLKGDNMLWQRKYEIAAHDLEILKLSIVDKDKESQRSRRKIAELEEIIESMRKELDERSHTIGQKETRILEIKQKNQELEKYRFVLDYKINELKNELSMKLLQK